MDWIIPTVIGRTKSSNPVTLK